MLLNLVRNVYFFLFIAFPCEQGALNHLIQWARLRKNQVTLQILIFGPIILNLVKKLSFSHFTALCYVQGARKKLKTASFTEHA